MNIIKQDIKTIKDSPNSIIAHIVNDRGAWGAGVSGVISEMYPLAEQMYRGWSQYILDIPNLMPKFELGENQILPVNSVTNTVVANMLAQKGLRSAKNKVPFRMNHFITCFTKLCEYAKSNNMDIHMPKVGSGLGGGDWDEISTMIENIGDSYGVNINVYFIE